MESGTHVRTDAEKKYADAAMTIASQYMPGQVGGWGDETSINQADVYRRITNLPRGRLYFAGDIYSQVPGSRERSVDSARLAIASILSRKPSTDPDLTDPGPRRPRPQRQVSSVRTPRRVRVTRPLRQLPRHLARW